MVDFLFRTSQKSVLNAAQQIVGGIPLSRYLVNPQFPEESGLLPRTIKITKQQQTQEPISYQQDNPALRTSTLKYQRTTEGGHRWSYTLSLRADDNPQEEIAKLNIDCLIYPPIGNPSIKTETRLMVPIQTNEMYELRTSQHFQLNPSIRKETTPTRTIQRLSPNRTDPRLVNSELLLRTDEIEDTPFTGENLEQVFTLIETPTRLNQ